MRTTEYTVASGEVKRYQHRKTANCNFSYRSIFIAVNRASLSHLGDGTDWQQLQRLWNRDVRILKILIHFQPSI